MTTTSRTGSEWNKPLPTVVGETKPYWDSCRRGELLIQKCDSCDEYQFYPRGICANCWSEGIRWVHATGRGTVWTYTVTYPEPHPGLCRGCALRAGGWWNWKRGSRCSPTSWNATPER